MPKPIPLYLRRISAPTAEIITLAEAKLYLRVDHSQEDIFISELIVAVRMFAEDYLGLSLVTQDWQVGFDEAYEKYALPMKPVQHINQMDVVQGDVSHILSDDAYELRYPNIVAINQSNIAEISIQYRAGNDALNQPMALKQAMFAHIALCYERRGEDILQPLPAHRLYEPYKEVQI